MKLHSKRVEKIAVTCELSSQGLDLLRPFDLLLLLLIDSGLLNSLAKLLLSLRTENYTRNEWERLEKYTRNEWRRLENTLETSGKYEKLHSKRGEKMGKYTRNGWRRRKTTLETSGEDVKLHSKRVEKM